MSENSNRPPVEKIIPSKPEKALQQFLYRFGKYIPQNITPNQITAIGAFGGLSAIIAMVMTEFSKWFYLLVIFGVLVHIIADDLDGYVARSRNMSSKAGGYFDLITDILFSTFLIIALGLSDYADLRIAVFLIPAYGIIIVTAMHYILHFNEFLFPRIGPFEAHLGYIILAIGGLIFGKKVLVGSLHFADIVMLISVIPTYYEMIRLQIQLFKRLKASETGEI